LLTRQIYWLAIQNGALAVYVNRLAILRRSLAHQIDGLTVRDFTSSKALEINWLAGSRGILTDNVDWLTVSNRLAALEEDRLAIGKTILAFGVNWQMSRTRRTKDELGISEYLVGAPLRTGVLDVAEDLIRPSLGVGVLDIAK
jgi:hypothetical protein